MLTVFGGASAVNPPRATGLALWAGAVFAVAMSHGIAGQMDLAVPGRRAPELERLFTPPAAPEGMYEVYESPTPIARLAAALRARDPSPARGAWEPRRLGAGDAFGAEGAYDRAKLALLIGGRRITTVRGSLRGPDGGTTGYTLLSPYPDASLTELRPGTMVIVFHVPRRPR